MERSLMTTEARYHGAAPRSAGGGALRGNLQTGPPKRPTMQPCIHTQGQNRERATRAVSWQRARPAMAAMSSQALPEDGPEHGCPGRLLGMLGLLSSPELPQRRRGDRMCCRGIRYLEFTQVSLALRTERRRQAGQSDGRRRIFRAIAKSCFSQPEPEAGPANGGQRKCGPKPVSPAFQMPAPCGKTASPP